FFQAEDGIRDRNVTGVQTCALPISFPRLTDAALRALCSCAWRGNVRELQNVIEHVAVVVEPGADIRPEDLHLTGDPTPEVTGARSEERRVGKEGRARCAAEPQKQDR